MHRRIRRADDAGRCSDERQHPDCGSLASLNRPGAAFDPATDRWRGVAPAPASFDREGIRRLTWTGREILAWGESFAGLRAKFHVGPVPSVGASYLVDEDAWVDLPPAPIFGRSGSLTAWMDRELIIGGGGDPSIAAYEPRSRRWRKVPSPNDAPLVQARWVSAPGRLVVAGGLGVDAASGRRRAGSDAMSFEPARDVWRTLPPIPGPGRFGFAMAAADDEVVVWGGEWLDGDERRLFDDGFSLRMGGSGGSEHSRTERGRRRSTALTIGRSVRGGDAPKLDRQRSEKDSTDKMRW